MIRNLKSDSDSDLDSKSLAHTNTLFALIMSTSKFFSIRVSIHFLF